MSSRYRALGLGTVLFFALALPRTSFAVSGCTNGYLLGTYNAQVTSFNVQNALQSMSTGSTTTGGVTPSGSGTPVPTVGLGSNPGSISGSLPGEGRYYFDGAGTIVGVAQNDNGGTFSTGIGTYKVGDDCMAQITLVSGAKYDAVIADSGRQVMFVQTDSSAPGSSGVLLRTSSCIGLSYPHSYGFTFSGATQTAATTTDNDGTPRTTTTPQASLYSAIGTIVTDGRGAFYLSQTTVANGTTTRSKAAGTYTVGNDCSIKLNFSPASSTDTTTGMATLPVSFRGLTVDSGGGILVLQPDKTNTLTGTFIAQ